MATVIMGVTVIRVDMEIRAGRGNSGSHSNSVGYGIMAVAVI